MTMRKPDIESIGRGRAFLRSRGLSECDLAELVDLLDHSPTLCEQADALHRQRHGNGHANEWPIAEAAIDEQEI
jgi:hypothetical protein